MDLNKVAAFIFTAILVVIVFIGISDWTFWHFLLHMIISCVVGVGIIVLYYYIYKIIIILKYWILKD